MTKDRDLSVYYIIHVSDDCPWCVRAKALLEHYGVEYQVKTDKCPEWPTWPAIYRICDGEPELIGGYDQLISLSYDTGL